MSDLLDKARVSKESAKRNRNSGRFDEALGDLRAAIDLLQPELEGLTGSDAGSPWARELAREVADCNGMIGGVQRRLHRVHTERAHMRRGEALLARARGDQAESARLEQDAAAAEAAARDALNRAREAYERGAAYETTPSYRIEDTYNRVNAMVMRILADPAEIVRMSELLDEAIEDLQVQVAGSRRDQWWAWADLGLCRLLQGDVAGALRDYDRLKATGARSSDYESTVEVLTQLDERLGRSTSDREREIARGLVKGIEHLDRSKYVPRQLCFVAMPFGTKPAPDGAAAVAFDTIYPVFQEAVLAAGLECLRADYDPGGGLIVRSMYEALVLAEYVLADLTFPNPNVMYELGLRHGAARGATILLCAEGSVGRLPFGVRDLRVLTYELDEKGALVDADGLRRKLAERIALARDGRLPNDNPLLQVTRLGPGPEAEHEKTDLFLRRLEVAGDLERRVAEAIAEPSRQRAVAGLTGVENDLTARGTTVQQVNSAWLALYLGYREKGAYDEMVRLFDKLPPSLQATAVVREQLALAVNRLAEQADRRGDDLEARGHRARAHLVLKPLLDSRPTSETFGILGRIHKGAFRAELTASETDPSRAPLASAALDAAIKAYERGFRADIRDFYPGTNTLTLRAYRRRDEDQAAIAAMAPVVRYAVDAAPPVKASQEDYWRQATRFELACVEEDWGAADRHLETLMSLPAEAFMRETTADTLELLARSPGRPEIDRGRLRDFAQKLKRLVGG